MKSVKNLDAFGLTLLAMYLASLKSDPGRKTLENEILKEAVDFAKAKKWIARSPVLPGEEP